MMKKFVFLLCTLVFAAAAAVSAFAADKFLAKSMAAGSDVFFDGYTIDDSNFFAIRDIAKLLENTDGRFYVDSSENTVRFIKGADYETAGFEFYESAGKKQCYSEQTDITLICGENEINAESYIINERCYVKLRDIAKVLEYGVNWDNDERIIGIGDEDGENMLTYISLHEPILYDPLKPMVALTFDDGPSVNTPHILDTLNRYNASATFFVVGTNAEKYPNILRDAIASGCQIGNHTYDHSNLVNFSDAKIKAKVESVQNIVYKATGIYPTFLRPPYGSYNARVKNAIGLKMINWNVDTRDWQSRNADSVYREALRNIRDGNVILMHDLYGSTANAVDRIVPELKRQGFQMVTLEQLYEARGMLSGQIK